MTRVTVKASTIQNALKVLSAQGQTQSNGVETSTAPAPALLPTAKTRAALDYLCDMTPEKLREQEVNLKPIVNDLFDWTGVKKGTKAVVRALNQALNTPGKYSHAVELTAYLSSLANLLEPDRIVRLFSLIDEVETAYAPTRFTMQRSYKLEELLKGFSPERQEKIVRSLWIEIHQGRWWDISSSKRKKAPEAPELTKEEIKEIESNLLSLFADGDLPWNPTNVKLLQGFRKKQELIDTIDDINLKLAQGKNVDPDIPVLISHISWLAPLQRAELPFESLLDRLFYLKKEVEFDYPQRPESFSEMFPDISLYGHFEIFPYPNSVLDTDNAMLASNRSAPIRLELVKNALELAANRDYMGNCTWGKKASMDKGSYILYRVHTPDGILNMGCHLTNNRWVVSEINSRHNRGGVPAQVRQLLTTFVSQMPTYTADNGATQMMAMKDKLNKLSGKRFKYSLV